MKCVTALFVFLVAALHVHGDPQNVTQALEDLQQQVNALEDKVTNSTTVRVERVDLTPQNLTTSGEYPATIGNVHKHSAFVCHRMGDLVSCTLQVWMSSVVLHEFSYREYLSVFLSAELLPWPMATQVPAATHQYPSEYAAFPASGGFSQDGQSYGNVDASLYLFTSTNHFSWIPQFPPHHKAFELRLSTRRAQTLTGPTCSCTMLHASMQHVEFFASFTYQAEAQV